MKFLLRVALFLFVTIPSEAQSKNDWCYRNRKVTDEKVFERMEIYPAYKEGIDKLNQFLLSHIDVDAVVASLNKQTRFVGDTLKVQFVISKDKQMSDLTITGSGNPEIKKSIQTALVKSACGWLPGESSGKYLTGWFKNSLGFTLDRRGQFLATKIEWLDSFYK